VDDLDVAHPVASKKVDKRPEPPVRTPREEVRVAAPSETSAPPPAPAAPKAEAPPAAPIPVRRGAASRTAPPAPPAAPIRVAEAPTARPSRRSPDYLVAAGLLVLAGGVAGWAALPDAPPAAATSTSERDARDRDLLVARTAELEAATRRSATDRDLAKSERDDAVTTLEGSRREADAWSVAGGG
jgi:translation initiation factor IF-2